MNGRHETRRRHTLLRAGLLLALLLAVAGLVRTETGSHAQAARPFALLPENPRYFLFRGRPTVLVTSGEHYGAVVNRDFDYVPYLDELARHGFNQTRLFTGAHLEDPGFIPGLDYDNTLAPRPGRALVPWARSDAPGAAVGGNRFDLSRWDPEYFDRLRDFVGEAGARGIVVEVVLFSVHYEGRNWLLSPLHPGNNVNGTPRLPLWQVFRDEGRALLPYQTELARKLVRELRDYDNVYFELLNEPHYACLPVADACAPDAWQAEILAALADEQGRTGSAHLVAQNVPLERVTGLDPRISVVNLHYAPPELVRANASLRRPLVLDETGQEGAAADAYRLGAWRFMLAGGSGVSHLDFSFGPDDERGTIPGDRFTRGGGGSEIRRQLAVLKRFLDRFDLRRTRPAPALVRASEGRAFALTDGTRVGVFVEGAARTTLTLRRPPGAYAAVWTSTRDGRPLGRLRLGHPGGELELASPPFDGDVALLLRRLPGR